MELVLYFENLEVVYASSGLKPGFADRHDSDERSVQNVVDYH